MDPYMDPHGSKTGSYMDPYIWVLHGSQMDPCMDRYMDPIWILYGSLYGPSYGSHMDPVWILHGSLCYMVPYWGSDTNKQCTVEKPRKSLKPRLYYKKLKAKRPHKNLTLESKIRDALSGPTKNTLPLLVNSLTRVRVEPARTGYLWRSCQRLLETSMAGEPG